jgi:hypothetical protein
MVTGQRNEKPQTHKKFLPPKMMHTCQYVAVCVSERKSKGKLDFCVLCLEFICILNFAMKGITFSESSKGNVNFLKCEKYNLFSSDSSKLHPWAFKPWHLM